MDSKTIELEGLETRLTQIDSIQNYLNQDLKDLDVKFNQAMEIRSKNGGRFSELEAIFKESSNHVVTLKTKLDLTAATISEEQTTQRKLSSQMTELEKNISNVRQAYEKRTSDFCQTKEQYEEKVKDLQRSEELLETLTVGLSGSEGQDNGYMEQLKGRTVFLT